MIRPATKHTLEIVAGCLAVIVLCGTILACKLASGPISLKFLAPTLAAMLSEDIGDYRVDVKDAVMRWSPAEHAVTLRIVGVDFYDRSSRLVAGIPEMDVGLAMIGWKDGIVAPTRVSLDQASAVIERDVDGAFSIGAPDKKGEASLLPVVLSQLLVGKGSAVSYLSELSVKDADLTLIDHRTGAVIRAPQSRLIFQHTEKGFSAHMEAPAEIADERFAITLDGDFDTKAQRGAVDVKFSPVRLSHLAMLSAFYKVLAPLDVAVGGTAHLDLGADAVITRAELSLASEGGAFVPQGEGVEPIPVQFASFKGTYLPRTGHVTISELKYEASGNRAELSGGVDLETVEGKGLSLAGLNADLRAINLGLAWPARFPEPLAFDEASLRAKVGLGTGWYAEILSASLSDGALKLYLTGSVARGEPTPVVKINGAITNLEIGELGKYWPANLVPSARRWVTRHVHSGLMTRGVLTIDAPPGALAAETIGENVLRFDFHVDNGVAEYVFGMPPLTGLSADMSLTPRAFSLDLRGGKILTTEVTSGRVTIPELGVMGSPIEIAVQGHGDLTELLQVADSKPLGVITKYGFKPENLGGRARLDVKLTVPQQSNIPGQRIEYNVVAKGEEVKVGGVFKGISIDNGSVDVAINNDGLEGKGKFALNGEPTDIVWHEKFHDGGPKPTEFVVKTTLDDEARASLGFGSGSYVLGPVGVDVTARGAGRKIREVQGKIDLTRSAIDLGEYDWSKAQGVPASAQFHAEFTDDGAIKIKHVTAAGRGVDISGRASIAADGRLLSANFPRLKLEGSADLSLVTDRQGTDGLVAKLDGRFLDLGPTLKQTLERSEKIGTVPWRIEARLDEVRLRKGVEASAFSATIASTGKRLRLVRSKGRLSSAGDFSADLNETADGARWLNINSSDAGSFVKGMTGIESFLGGRLALNVRLDDSNPVPPATPPPSPAAADGPPAPVHKPQSGVAGTLKIDDFKVVNAPVLARLLTVGSLQGISDLLNGQGIEFSHLDMPFWLEKGRLGIEDGRAAGPAIGITMQGIVDRTQKVTDLNGTIVPAYSLNSALGNVPVLGQLLVSRPGEGVFGFTYNVAGGVDEPEVTVNPLSALAPGFLRRLFELGETQAGELHNRTVPTAQ